MPSVRIRVGYVKTGIKKRGIFCETHRDGKGNLYYKFSFDSSSTPKFLFKEWACEKHLGSFFIDKTEDQWPDYYQKIKRNPLIHLEHESFDGVVADCVLEAL